MTCIHEHTIEYRVGVFQQIGVFHWESKKLSMHRVSCGGKCKGTALPCPYTSL